MGGTLGSCRRQANNGPLVREDIAVSVYTMKSAHPSVVINMKILDSVGELKRRIYAEEGVPPEQQRICVSVPTGCCRYYVETDMADHTHLGQILTMKVNKTTGHRTLAVNLFARLKSG